MNAEKLNFSRIFQVEGITEHYHVPKYQRQYTWRLYNWETLLNDITENEAGYFMGSIIVVNDKSDTRPNIETIYQVVDGQQRLTTMSILLCAIYKKYAEIQQNKDLDEFEKEDFTVKISNLRKKLIKIKPKQYDKEFGGFEYTTNQTAFLRVQPSTQDSNLDDYKFLLTQIGVLKNIGQPKNFKRRLFYKAFKYFIENLPNGKNELDDLVERINSLNFIHISVGTQADAFTLFETLNNRGVPLSPIDIIKNSLLSEMDKKHDQRIDISYNQWQKLLNYIPDFDNQIRFLRQFYNAFKIEPWIKHERFAVATRSNLIQIYEKLIKIDTFKTFTEILTKGNIYGLLINSVTEIDALDEDIDSKESEQSFLITQSFIDSIIELNQVGASASYTILLFLIANHQHLENPNTIIEIIQFLIKYYVRRNVTDSPNTRDLDAININIVEECNKIIQEGYKITTQNIVEAHITNQRAVPATLPKFIEALSDKIYDNNVGMTRYLLWKLDNIHHTREYAPNLWERNQNDVFIWTIEHIFPEGKEIRQEWIDMIAEGNKEKAIEIQEEYVHTLGNLTLSAYNSNLSNRPFIDKQNLTTKRVGNIDLKIGYKNGLMLNKIAFIHNSEPKTLDTIERWDVAAINARTNVMINKLVDLFKFDGEEVN